MSDTENNSPDENKDERLQVRVTGLVVLVTLDDGSIRQAHLEQVEHMRTILNICSMNDKGSLILGGEDFAPLLSSYFINDEPSPSP